MVIKNTKGFIFVILILKELNYNTNGYSNSLFIFNN